MKVKKSLLLCILICLLIGSVCFLIFGKNLFRKEEPQTFYDMIMQEDFSDMTLTIYYRTSHIFTPIPVSLEDLINEATHSNDDQISGVITFGEKELRKNKKLLKKMVQTELEPVHNTSGIHAYFYLRFDSEKSGKLYDVALWGSNSSMFVCDQQVQEETIFYKVIAAFYPESDHRMIQRYVK